MTFETELANIGHPTDVISEGISDALVQAVVVTPLVYAEELPAETNVKLFRKDGSLVADKQAESAAISFSADEELTQTEVTVTATKTAVATKLTVEAQDFSRMTADEIAQKQGQAIARDWDDNALALISSLSTNSVTAASICTMEDLLKAAYKVRSGTAGVSRGRLAAVLDYKAVFELQKELVTSGAGSFSNDALLALLMGGELPANGYRGTVANIDVFECNGFPTSGGDNVQAVFDPMLAFCGMYSSSMTTKFIEVGSGGGWTEIWTYAYDDVAIYNDAAASQLLSDS